MKAVVQRVSRASSTPGGAIGPGLVVLLGIAEGDDEGGIARLAEKVARLRIFQNDEGKFDRSLLDTEGAALVVPQFTLIADTAKGNRPSFSARGAAGGGRRRSTRASALRYASSASRSRPASSVPTWRSSS